MSRPFTKPATTIAQQLQHLQAEGMPIPNVARTEHWLRHVSYYRLSAYRLPFEYPKGNPGPRFLPGTSFDTVTALYDFDRRLRPKPSRSSLDRRPRRIVQTHSTR